MDYLTKNLRAQRRGGKTCNFTTRTESADPLFVFHREVQKVRERLAAGAQVKWHPPHMEARFREGQAISTIQNSVAARSGSWNRLRRSRDPSS